MRARSGQPGGHRVVATPLATPLATAEPLDFRLAIGAIAAWLAVLGFGGRSPLVVVTTAGIAALVGVLALVAGRRLRRAGPALALIAFCVALVLVPLAARLTHVADSALSALAREHAVVVLTARVASDPAVLAAKGIAGAPRVAVDVTAAQVRAAGRTVGSDGAVLVLADAASWRDVLPGQLVQVAGELSPALDRASMSVTLFARAPPQLLGAPPWWQRLAGDVRGGLRQAAAGLPEQARGLLPGLIDGDTANLDPVLAERFRLAGLTHLVAVSGTNCSIVVGALLLVLRRARLRPWLQALLGGALLMMFVVVARPSPSVLRAALMAAVALVSLATGRPRSAIPSLAAVTLGLLLWDPTLAGSASFAMSVLATGALLVLAPGWALALRRRRVPVGVAESIAVAAAAHLVTAPVVAAISGRVSLVAIPANVLAEPVVAVTTVLGFAAAVVSPWWLPGASGLAWLAGWPCRWLIAVADFFGGLHGATAPWPGGVGGGLALLALLAALVIGALRTGPRRALAAAGATCVALAIPIRAATSGWPPPGWIFVACDVGQGDALVLNAGAGAAVEIDAGPDPVPIDRCLGDLDVTSIPLLVLTHFHVDHVGGLAGAGRGRQVGAILAGPLDDPEAGASIVHRFAAQRGLVVRTPPAGTSVQVGDVRLDVLGPSHPYRDTRSDPNNSSLVLRATVRGTRILLPGDAEVEAQRALLAAHVDLRADVLKVPHHGSAYSDPRFLAAAHARVAVISVGRHNDYGHPSPLLLRELAVLGVPTLRTDRDGDVAITGTAGQVTAVPRGVAASTVGLREPATPVGPAVPFESAAPVLAPTEGARWSQLSAAGDRMATCPPAPSASTTCPTRCPRWRWSSGTRSCSSSGPSARSPPPPAAPIPASRSPSSPARRSTVRNCTSCSARRCSASPACW